MNKITELIKKIDGPLFKEQRQVIAELIDDAYQEESDIRALEGLQNLLDEIADIAHDQYGIDCLLDMPDPEELYSMEDWQYDVANGDTKLGYTEWVAHNVESHEEC
jgi:hypothetical protein